MAEIIERSTVFSTAWFDVVAKRVASRPAGDPYYSLELPDYVSVLATTAEREILLVRQYRPAVEQATLELPGGHVDGDEPPESAARRELLEETGYAAAELELLGCIVPDSGRLSNRLWCYFAPGVERSSEVRELEPGIELVRCSHSELLVEIAGARFVHSMHLAVVLLATLQRKLA
jgi:ADP-ribose pyrophosphatase